MFILKEFGQDLIFNQLKTYSDEILILSVLIFVVYQLSYRQKWKGKLPPGPTGLPLLGYLPFLGSQPAKSLATLAIKYGNIMGLRLGRNYTVVVSDYKLMKEILNNPDALDRPLGLFDPIPSVGFNNLNGEEWLSQKKFCMVAIKNLGLGRQHWETLITRDVQPFLQDLKATNGQPIEVESMLISIIMGNLTSLLFGRRIDTDSAEISVLLDFLNTLKIIGPYHASKSIPYLRKIQEYFGLSIYGQEMKAINSANNFIRKEIAKHKEMTEQKEKEDLINLYLQEWKRMSLLNKKHYFNDINLQGNVAIILIGSIDTSTGTLEWLFRLLATHPDVQRKVQAELEDVIGQEGSVTYFERNRVPYCFASIMETQRIASVVPLSTTRRASEDILLSNYTIPKGTDIFGNIWAIHNNPEYWKEPEKFKPERFLTDDQKTLLPNPPNFVPFSTGRRNCPGETIANINIFVIFIHVMQKFWISMPHGMKPIFDQEGGIIAHLKPQPLCFTERT